MLAFEKDIHTPSFIDVLPVINSQDIYLAQQVAAQTNFGLSVWEYIAMDANGDGVITGLDAYNITQRIFIMIAHCSKMVQMFVLLKMNCIKMIQHYNL